MLHDALEKNTTKLVILESPTGTGKTYSLLVPLIVWLKKNPTNLNTLPLNEQKKILPNWLKKTADHKG
jgi:Rad3-related DNA helicase